MPKTALCVECVAPIVQGSGGWECSRCGLQHLVTRSGERLTVTAILESVEETTGRLAANVMQSGVCYVVAALDQNALKVGYTTDMKRRLSTLRGSNPTEIVVVDVIAGGRISESRIQSALESLGKRIRGEWFIDDAESRSCLRELGVRA